MESIEIDELPTQKLKIKLNRKTKSRYQKKIDSSQTFLSLIKKNPMSDAVIQEVKKRQIRVNEKWLTDFASCNYLGLDVHPEVMASVNDHIEKLTTYPGQSRLLGSPYLYEKIEGEIIKLTGLPDCILMPSISLTHLFALPILAKEGDLFLDKRAHKTIYDGCMRATLYGAKIKSFNHNDAHDLEEKLSQSKAETKLICVDGVYSMHGYTPPLKKMLTLAKKYDAKLYIDDAHGFGVLGKRSSSELSSFGTEGGGIIQYYSENYEQITYIAGLSKAYSALLGFIGCKSEEKDFLKVSIDPYLYSGPAPIAALSCLLKSFEINRREGDEIRAHLYKISKNLEKGIDEMGWKNENHTGFPVYRLTMEQAEDMDFVGNFLYEHGIYVTLAPYPLVPRHEAGFRIQLTAANTQAEVDHLMEVLKKLNKKVKIKRRNESEINHSLNVKINAGGSKKINTKIENKLKNSII